MALFVAMTFWLLIIVLSAWGVHQLWGGLAKPRVVNTLLLPGTLVAQLGHVLGLLVTGATVSNTRLYSDDESGEPATTQDAKPRIPVIGPVIIGMLPLLACACAIFFVARYLGQSVTNGVAFEGVSKALPTTLAGWWQMMRDLVSLTESLVDATMRSLPGSWTLWAFIYLLICLTVRMAPFPGNLRGSLGAIVLLGVITAIVSTVLSSLSTYIEAGWIVLSLTVATLALLLLVSAIIRGLIALGRLLAQNG